jgi:long-subunit fatty acid transport protein
MCRVLRLAAIADRRPLALAFLLAAAPAAAQDPFDYHNLDDFSSEVLYATGTLGIGARAMGLGGNYVGIADDATALYWNPAGLAQLVRIETSLGLHSQYDESTHDMFGTTASADATYSGLDHLAIAYPLPTDHGSFVVAGGVFRARTNVLDTMRLDRRAGGGVAFHDDFSRAQRGGLWRYTGGLGVDLLDGFAFGVGLSYWEGSLQDDQLRSIDERGLIPSISPYVDRLVTDADVEGFSFDLGLLAYSGKRARLGLALRSPVWLDIQGHGVFEHLANPPDASYSEELFIDDQPRLPWSAGLGGSLGTGLLLVTAEVRFTAWDEVESVPISGGAPLPGADPDYASKLGGGAGVELSMPGLPVRLRGGWAYEPQPYQLLLGNGSELDPDRQRVTAGLGVLFGDAFALDTALTWAQYTRLDAAFPAVFEQREEWRAYLTGAYRF